MSDRSSISPKANGSEAKFHGYRLRVYREKNPSDLTGGRFWRCEVHDEDGNLLSGFLEGVGHLSESDAEDNAEQVAREHSREHGDRKAHV